MNDEQITGTYERMTEVAIRVNKTGEIVHRFYPATFDRMEMNVDYSNNVITPWIKQMEKSLGLKSGDTTILFADMKIKMPLTRGTA